MVDKIIAKSNIANKIRNTVLSRKKGLMPLFELISNSIHSIFERAAADLMDFNFIDFGGKFLNELNGVL